MPLLFQVQAIITYPKLFSKSDLKCSELIEEKAHAAAAKVIYPMSFRNLDYKDERVLEFLVYEGKDKELR